VQQRVTAYREANGLTATPTDEGALRTDADAALVGKIAFDVMLILKRGREKVTDCVVEIEAERADGDPKIFTGIKLLYKITGRGLSRDKVERAVALSDEKYCSATAQLRALAKISHEIEIIEAE